MIEKANIFYDLYQYNVSSLRFVIHLDGGRFILIKIYFRSNKECEYFLHLLQNEKKFIETKHKRNTYWGNEIHIYSYIPVRKLIFHFVDVIHSFRLNRMIKHIATHTYYYTDKEDIEKICEWTNWLLEEPLMSHRLFNDQSVTQYLFYLLFS